MAQGCNNGTCCHVGLQGDSLGDLCLLHTTAKLPWQGPRGPEPCWASWHLPSTCPGSSALNLPAPSTGHCVRVAASARLVPTARVLLGRAVVCALPAACCPQSHLQQEALGWAEQADSEVTAAPVGKVRAREGSAGLGECCELAAVQKAAAAPPLGAGHPLAALAGRQSQAPSGD